MHLDHCLSTSIRYCTPLFELASIAQAVTSKHGTMRKQLISTLLLSILALNICTSNGNYDLKMREDATHTGRHNLHRKQTHGYHAHAKISSNVHHDHQNVKYGKALKGNGSAYSDKKQLIAFLLSLIFFGAGRIYVGHYIIGSIQMFLLQLLLFLIVMKDKWILMQIRSFIEVTQKENIAFTYQSKDERKYNCTPYISVLTTMVVIYF